MATGSGKWHRALGGSSIWESANKNINQCAVTMGLAHWIHLAEQILFASGQIDTEWTFFSFCQQDNVPFFFG